MEAVVAHTNRPVLGFDNSWKAHIAATLALGLPLIGAQLAQLGINVTDVFIIGRLGTAELAAMVLASQYLFTIFIFGSGFSTAVVPLAAQAYAQADLIRMRRAVRMGLWAVLTFSIVTIPLLMSAEQVLLLAGQKPHIAKLAGDYLAVAGWGIFPGLGTMVLRAYLSAVGKAGFILYSTLIVLLFNAVLAYIVVLGHFGVPQLGMFGAALIALLANILGFVISVIYIEKVESLHSHRIFERFWRADWSMLWEVLRLGLPISLTILAEVSLFTVASLLMGWIGTVELAAHGIALQWASIAFMIPLGLAQAATVRVGLAVGGQDLLALKRASWVIVAMSVISCAIGGLIFFFCSRTLAAFFLDTSKTDSAEVLTYAASLMIVAGIFQLVDGLQVVGSGLLRGVKDTTIPMIIALVSYWAIGFSLAYLLAFKVGFGGMGVWIGFLCGLSAAAVLLLTRYVFLVRKTSLVG